jgi:hypothetical protein
LLSILTDPSHFEAASHLEDGARFKVYEARCVAAACGALGRIAVPEAIDALIKAGVEGEGGAPDEARRALSCVDPAKVVPVLLRLLNAKYKPVMEIVRGISVERHIVILRTGEWAEPSNLCLHSGLCPQA